MTEQEFDMQVWRRFDLVTTDTGIETTIMNVCFSSRSVRIYIKSAPPEWIHCEHIVSHKSRLGGDGDDGAIIEELHQKCNLQADKISQMREEIKKLKDNGGKNYPRELLKAVNQIEQGMKVKKSKLEKVEKGLEALNDTLEKINVDFGLITDDTD